MLYMLVPWIGVMALGLWLGPIVVWSVARSRAKSLLGIGLGMTAALFVFAGG